MMDDLGARLASLDDDMLGLIHEFLLTTTGNAREEWERVCALNGIHFDETGSAIGFEGMIVDCPTPDFIEALEVAAVDFDKIKLARSTLSIWRDKVANIREMEKQADQFCEKRLLKTVLQQWRSKTQEAMRRNAIFERRLDMFREWRDACIVASCLRRWVMAHRLKSMEKFQERQAGRKALAVWRDKVADIKRTQQQAEDARDYYAASSVLKLWREKTAESKARRKFKNFYLMAKYGTILAQAFRARKKARTEAELTRRYVSFVHEKDEKLKRTTLEQWHTKTMQIREDEITADEYHEGVQDQRAKSTAHNALRKMYDQTIENQENSEIAQAHYEKNLVDRLGLLDVGGKWRTQARETKENERRADEYREIKTEEKAQSALRTMRNAAARTKQMNAMADEWREKQDKKKAAGFLALWRQKTREAREKRGLGGYTEAAMPQTPAAKKSALLK